MEFQEYVKGGRTIRATETAYKAIYKQQGFTLKTAAPIKGVVTDEGTSGTPKDGSGTDDNGKSATAGKPKKSK